jgi:hypothetical protein
MAVIDFLKLLELGLITNLLGLATAVVVLVFFLFTKLLSQKRAIAYCAFLFCGTAVAHLQWMIYSRVEGDEIGWQILATIVSVLLSSILGFWASRRSLWYDKLLLVIVIMTILLGVLQAGSMLSVLPYQLLNLYACIYALICILAPGIVTFRIWSSRE